MTDHPQTRQDMKRFLSQHQTHTVIVKFHASWCKPCSFISPIVEREYANVPGKKSFLSINVDEQQDIASCYRIRSLPTLMSFVEGMPHHSVTSSQENDIVRFFNKHC